MIEKHWIKAAEMEYNMYYGECRCCLTRGNHRDMKEQYNDNGVIEVYFDMFKESLNLSLLKHSQLTTLICHRCVTRLRDARTFRMMSAGTERHLLTKLGNNRTVFVEVDETNIYCDVKNEPVMVKVEVPHDEGDDDFLTDDIHEDNGLSSSASASSASWRLAEAALLSRHARVPALPARRALHHICPDYIRQLDILSHLEVTPAMIPMLEETREAKGVLTPKNKYISEKSAQITNATILIKYSNMTPFRSKSRSGYPCFYCRILHEDFTKLREHTSEHKTSELYRVLKAFGPESMVVYADVTDLKCSLCNQSLPNINELKSHLSKLHDKIIVTEVSDRVIPFKIGADKYRCQICECIFETFGSIERHMNGHYRNYVCKDCGTGFVTKYRLKVHSKSMHGDGNFPCEVCGKMFVTQQKYKNHVNTVHKLLKRFKCAKCPERFSEYFRRQKHMVENHGVAPLKYNCNVCDRSFDRRYTLSRHLKRDHLEERDFECEICSYKCFTNNELKVHMVKHNGERIFECSVCKKSYARKKTLREHMRIHNNDRRFVCPACGQAFVQKCSLKGHLKTHHMEYLS